MQKEFLIALISDNNINNISKALGILENLKDADTIVIDNGSSYNLIDEIEDYKSTKCILVETQMGYGECFFAAYNFAKDMDYKYLITIDSKSNDIIKEIEAIKENLKYGYDFVTCSRILENYDYTKVDTAATEITETLCNSLNEACEFNLTDPLSPNKGFIIESLSQMELTETSHGIFLQIFIQGAYFGYNSIEIPSHSGLILGEELIEYDNPVEKFLSIIETEKFLYNKGTIN